MRLYVLIMLSFFVVNGAFANVSISTILEKMAEMSEATGDVQANVKFTQRKYNKDKQLESIYYRRDKDDAFLIVMTSPETEKGNGYLRVGDNFWMYRRNTRSFQHINRNESIAGSDAQGDDFERKNMAQLYKASVDSNGKEEISEASLGKIKTWKFEIQASSGDVDYPKKICWVRKDNYLLLKEQSFALSGTLMQTAYYLKYTKIDGQYVSVKQIFIDEYEKGNKTVLTISGISTKKLPDNIFTKAYLENVSK